MTSADSFVGPAYQAHTRPRDEPPVVYEYTTGTCDVWQLGHLANFYAEKRWEPVFAVEAQRGIEVSSRVGDENGVSYEALKPYEVLFRRALKDEEVDGA